MLKNYFKIAWRNIRHNKGYTVLNIMGLAIGLAVFIVALLYVNHEKSYDRWNDQLERVYRTGVSETDDGEKKEVLWTAYPLGTQMMNTCPEVEAVTRITGQGERLIAVGENTYYENQIITADSSFFTVFPYTFVHGNRLTAFNQPSTAVISTEMSLKLFGKQNPVGKTFDLVLSPTERKAYTVTGVVEKTGPSHLDFSICFSYFNKDPNYWGRQIFHSYVLLKPGASAEALASKAKSIYVSGKAAYTFAQRSKDKPTLSEPGASPEEWLKANSGVEGISIFFEKITAIHLSPRATAWRDAAANHPAFDFEKGNNLPVVFFSIAALLVLLLACINYTNLAVARAGKRAKEAGMRKVMGAMRRQLMLQFLAEAFIQTMVALAIALLLSFWMVELINTAFNMQLRFWNELLPQSNLYFIGQLSLVVLLVTLFSGGYPAFILSSFRPAKVLKGDTTKNVKGKLLRNGLVITQFAISACFLIGLVVVYQQLAYMRNNDPGFSTEQVLVLKPNNNSAISPEEADNKLDFIKDQLSRIPGVTGVAATGSYPGMPSMGQQDAEFNGKTSEWTFDYIHFDYFDVLNMPLVAGRNFSRTHAMDTVNSAVINETAARQTGYKDPIGQKVSIMNREYMIIGVLKDNHVAGYTAEISPQIYAIGVEEGLLRGYDAILVKLDGHTAAQTAAAITNYWKTIEPAFPLRSSWLDQDFAKLIEKHERFGKITWLLAIISLLIALMGIFALSAFMAAQRTKEIGIRKVFGASVSNITLLLSRDFVVLVLLSLVIAMPLAYWVMNSWLQDFAYRITFSGWIFVFAAVVMIGVALLTVSIQSIRAAIVNPVKSLRAE